jgi:IMP dehydrogenase
MGKRTVKYVDSYNYFMPNLKHKNAALTFDDILLIPQYSEVESRKDVQIDTNVLGHDFTIPICSANMDTVTEVKMAKEMARLGGAGFLHRYASTEDVLKWVAELVSDGVVAIPSIGIKPQDLEAAKRYVDAGADAINIDIAHGDSLHMVKMVEALKALNIKVVAGNVATFEAAFRLATAGADVIKVGIGGGSMCTTRIVTGHGVPQITAIQECSRVRETFSNIKIIADGGIRNSGDMVKALAFGADMCMVGSLLAGTNETPGQIIETMKNGKWHTGKRYRGMASTGARASVAKVGADYTPEGVETTVDCTGPVEDIIAKLAGGIRSGLSYSGAWNIAQLRFEAQYSIITNNGIIESRPHGLK